MPIVNGLSLPDPLSNGTTADAVQVMADFNYLLAALNRALLDSGGGAGVNAQSVQIHNLANGTSANDAVNLSQLSTIDSPTFTGVPVAPTASPGANTAQLATTAFVAAAIAALVNAAPGALDTLKELADALGDDPNYATTITGLLAAKAPLVSPTFTGIPAAPTAAFGTSTTQLSTTAFVQGAKAANIQPVASAATITPAFPNDMVTVSALAVALNFANPTGSYPDGWGMVFRIKDNGTSRAITWGTAYRAIATSLPTTTVISKNLYVAMVWNATDTFWDVISVAEQ